MKKTLLSLLFVLVFITSGFCSDYRDALDEIAHTDIQMDAVTIEMALYLGWAVDDKAGVDKASQEAISALDEIESELVKLDVPAGVVELKDLMLDQIDILQDIYSGAADKSGEAIQKGFDSLEVKRSQFGEKWKEITTSLEASGDIVIFPEGVDYDREVMDLIRRQEDKDRYSEALDLMEKRKFQKAYNILENLRLAYHNRPFESCLKMKMSDCLLMSDTDIGGSDGVMPVDMGLELLLNIIESNVYSPVVYDAFRRWRSSEQMFYHGMSNWSNIPNKEYNKKRWQAFQTIKKHLKEHPEDDWAWAQATLLLALPNIGRGAYGNHNLVLWGRLYMDPEKLKGDE
ncbi:hypothetical protein ACFL38_05105 [Candidatus Omnitrophota bacterium]